jgi:hypothetical protein
MKGFGIIILLAMRSASAGPVDILLNPSATIEAREAVARQLDGLGLQRPLPVQEAIAELCHQVDFCGQASSDAEILASCPAYDASSPGLPTAEDDCRPRYVRENYTCPAGLEKQTLHNLRIFRAMQNDFQSTYMSLIYPQLVSVLGARYQIDFENLGNQGIAAVLSRNPEIMSIATEATALGQYTLGCYGQMNPLLFGRNEAKLTRYYNLFRATLNTLSLAPEFRGTVNRGVRLPPAVLRAHHKVGAVVCYNGFTSTAVHDETTDRGDDPRNAFLADKCVQRLYIRSTDKRTIPGRLISDMSATRGEREVLFAPGACFRVERVTPRTDNADADSEEDCAEGERFNFELRHVPSSGAAD